MVMLAAHRLRGEAYGVRIKDEIEGRSGRQVSRGSLYVTFDRLEAKGMIESDYCDLADNRGGRMRRYVRVTDAGLGALSEARQALLGLWSGLEPELDAEA